MATRIVIADDHKIVLQGLRSLLEQSPDLKVLAEADTGRIAVELAKTLHPDIVIMDVGLPDLNGVDATRQIVRDTPAIKVLALSMHADRRFVTGILQAGASGYLLKDSAFEELSLAIQTVMRGEIYLSPIITSLLVRQLVRQPPSGEPSALLTSREREVLQLLAEGKATKAVAHRLGVCVKTVETHRQQIMDKLNLHTIADLTKYAIREGLTFLDVLPRS
ncbi:MAG: response regulator transcription factor [Candidatus Limnocylindrales bacterium]|nr:response regulator transcription factor [Candidatus Limnocylindrales bacterium]